MTSFGALWLAVLVATVLVFLASSLIHMVLPWHKSDYPRSPREDAVLDALRPLALPPGDYFMPRASSGAEMKAPEFVEKMNRGPVVLMTVMPSGPMMMRGTFVQWFVFLAVVSALVGWVGCLMLPPASPSALVFKLTFATAFLAHGAAIWPLSIWYRRAWSLTIKGTVDAAIYAVITAATFVWLWPH